MSIGSRIKKLFFVTFRVMKYKWLSDCEKVEGYPVLYQPLLLKGKGRIIFKENVHIGVIASPGFYNGYSYIEARRPESVIYIGNNVSFNNCLSITAIAAVTIEDNSVIGVNCLIMDTDGHYLDPEKRNDPNLKGKAVVIKKNVFIGSNVTILKGVTIGENSVIGNGSIVTKDVPDNVVIAGNPARIIKTL